MDEDFIVVNDQVPAIMVASGDGIIAGPTGATGPAGPRGPAGYSILNGTTNPTSGVGQNGDFYINTSNSTMFGPKSGGVWGSGRSIVGPTGPQGPTGPTGPAGPTGTVVATFPYAGTGTAETAARSDHYHPTVVEGTPTADPAVSDWKVKGGYGGLTPPAGAALIKQAGTHATTVGDGGRMLIDFPVAFPNGIITIIPTIGAQTRDATTVTISGSTTKSTMVLVVRDSKGVPLTSNGTINVRINYFAVGW